MPDTPPKPPHGCWLFAGLVLAGLLGFAGAVAGIALDAPFPVVAGIMFGTPVLYIIGLIYLGVRHARKYGPAMTAEQREAWRIVGPFLGAFVVVAVLSFGGVFAAQASAPPGGRFRSCSSPPACCSASSRGRT
ncbi:MAG TPA: hypothetical protein VD866_04475 [Urbifossiella sp.]|nr:hypothetical protein [Urbifossiella sp.]